MKSAYTDTEFIHVYCTFYHAH